MSLDYDPETQPDAQSWLAMDESERISLVIAFHQERKLEAPNEQMHAVIHTVVENQAAMGKETPVPETLSRLMGEGISRHDAVHAVGTVLANRMWETMRGEGPPVDQNAAYAGELRKLTAEGWRRSFEDME